MQILNNFNIYKINNAIETRYLAKNTESGLTDLYFIVTQPNGIDLSPTLMSELEPGLYHAFFTPNSIGYWQARVSSSLSPKNVYSQSFFIVENYPTWVTTDTAFLTDFTYAEDNTESSTTATTTQNKLTTNWIPQSNGEYLIEWTFQLANSNVKPDFYSVQLNGIDIDSSQVDFNLNYADNGWVTVTSFTKISLTPINQIFTINFWANASTGYIRNARVKIYRVQ